MSPFFNKSKDSVQDNGDDAQDDNGHQHPGKLEEVRLQSERKLYKIQKKFCKNVNRIFDRNKVS